MGMHRNGPTGDFTRFHRENGHLPPPKWHKPSTPPIPRSESRLRNPQKWAYLRWVNGGTAGSLRSPKHKTDLSGAFNRQRHDSWLSWGPQSSMNCLVVEQAPWTTSVMVPWQDGKHKSTSGWIKTCGTTSLLAFAKPNQKGGWNIIISRGFSNPEESCLDIAPSQHQHTTSSTNLLSY